MWAKAQDLGNETHIHTTGKPKYKEQVHKEKATQNNFKNKEFRVS